MMKTASIALVLAAFIGLLPAGEAVACGDKFLVIGRTTRRVQKAKHPGSILLLLQADPQLAAAARSMKLEATLKQAGHTVETMTAATPLAEWLATRRYDLILTGLDGAPAIAFRAQALLEARDHPLERRCVVGASGDGSVGDPPSQKAVQLLYLGIAPDEAVAQLVLLAGELGAQPVVLGAEGFAFGLRPLRALLLIYGSANPFVDVFVSHWNHQARRVWRECRQCTSRCSGSSG